ncbi:hypothetical protein N7517_006127 [Penicillium concentricum]|uniref:Uncharacterized protein n=1 Tax=Penicillium concentricum TaxID=293559 RepID=A0A9W9S8M6_9EURO|nr:uncharacterized protein N7517_006127 [Penicillium concentricum]KAJ5374121.1 hypothetical protein N7517_006127 [Penicillium concentricum]
MNRPPSNLRSQIFRRQLRSNKNRLLIIMFPGYLDRDAKRVIVVHCMTSDADDSGADTGDDCAHYGEIIASIVVCVEEYVHPVRCSRVWLLH